MLFHQVAKYRRVYSRGQRAVCGIRFDVLGGNLRDSGDFQSSPEFIPILATRVLVSNRWSALVGAGKELTREVRMEPRASGARAEGGSCLQSESHATCQAHTGRGEGENGAR
jgi:hypothetical protein